MLVSGGETGIDFDDTYTVKLKDEAYGNLFIVYEKNIESYMVNAEFKKTGTTEFTLISPEGKKYTYEIKIERSSYEKKRIK